MITVAMWFFLTCGTFQIGSAIALHMQVRVPRFMAGRTAFGQLCQGTASMFLAQACATTDANLVTWVAGVGAPILMLYGLRADRRERSGT